MVCFDTLSRHYIEGKGVKIVSDLYLAEIIVDMRAQNMYLGHSGFISWQIPDLVQSLKIKQC